MGQTKVVLDTNVLISALGWKGHPREIFIQCLNKELDLIISPGQIEELLRVMEYPKFKFTKEQRETFISIILEIATIVETANQVNFIKEDPDDNLILETAIVGNVSYIISGDAHLLNLKTFVGIKIVTPNQFLETNLSSK